MKILAICPFCKEAHEFASGVPGNKAESPETGDFSICIDCGEWGVYDLSLPEILRKPTFPEYEKIVTDKRLQLVRRGWVEVVQKPKMRMLRRKPS